MCTDTPMRSCCNPFAPFHCRIFPAGKRPRGMHTKNMIMNSTEYVCRIMNVALRMSGSSNPTDTRPQWVGIILEMMVHQNILELCCCTAQLNVNEIFHSRQPCLALPLGYGSTKDTRKLWLLFCASVHCVAETSTGRQIEIWHSS